MSIHTPGGPAFPPPNGIHDGMTLRDYFAAAALTGDLARLGSDMKRLKVRAALGKREGIGVTEVTARIAYDIADAMLAERERG